MFSDPFLASYDKSGISAIADSEMLGRMQNADLFVINEEFPFSLRGEAMEDKQFTFRADPKYVEIFQELGVDIVTVANNHALDFGRDAFLDTLDTLKSANIACIGGGYHLSEASAPAGMPLTASPDCFRPMTPLCSIRKSQKPIQNMTM